MISGEPNEDRWRDLAASYAEMDEDGRHDAEYIRSRGLKPTILQLVGDCSGLRVLDAGCGPGWLFGSLRAGDRWECDISPPNERPSSINTSVQDVRSTSYPSEFFDVIVLSLVLMWVDDFEAVLREMHRIAKPNGRLVVSLVHPYFHRTGLVDSEGDFRISASLANQRAVPGHHISDRVGPLTYYHRRMDQYYNASIAAGWRLMHFRDWFIDPNDYIEHAAKRERLARRSHKVPIFTFYVCQRDN